MTPNPTVAEIVTFRLNDPHQAGAFRAAAQDMHPFLERCDGFLSRTLSCDPDGEWTDHILWASQDTAQAAAQALLGATEAEPFLQMIDAATVSMRHAEVHIAPGLAQTRPG